MIVGIVGENTTRDWDDAQQEWVYSFDEDVEYDIEWSVTTADDKDRPLGEVQPRERDDTAEYGDFTEMSSANTVAETGKRMYNAFM